MLYSLELPRVLPAMTTAKIEAVYVRPGDQLKAGDKILDLTIDLGSPFAQNCPPVSHYRIVAQEGALLRDLSVAAGDDREPLTSIAVFSVGSEEPADGSTARPLRTAVVGILRHADMWSMKQRV